MWAKSVVWDCMDILRQWSILNNMRVEYNNQTRLLAVIGDPIAHSLSPVLHNTMAKVLGLNYLYLACRVCPKDLPRWLDAARHHGAGGL